MSFATPGVEISGPTCTPARFGLLSVAEIEDRQDGHWLGGFYHEQESCAPLGIRTVECESSVTPKDTEGSGLSYPESDPIILIAPFECSTAGIRLQDAWDHAEARLSQGESRSLEKAFWTGVDELGNPIRSSLGGNPDVVDLTPVDGAVPLTTGVALLEAWAGQNMSCSPVLHSSRLLATYLAERYIIEADGNVMRARGTGTAVAVGGGYETSGPEGVAAAEGEAWIFISGAVKIERGVTFFTPDRGDVDAATNRVVNDITVFAERPYGFSLGCGVAAIRVTTCSCCC